MFIDTAKIYAKAGDGGNGAVAFRREKYVPKGGPSGGNGGDGGNIVFRTDGNLHTLLDFHYKKKYIAPNGGNGGTALKDGKKGKDIIIKVPVGTIIKNADSEEVLFDMSGQDMTLVLLRGGKGGKGNSNFATPTNQAPRFAENGKKGDEMPLVLELKLLADVGLVGFPNAGKSTFISVVSAARPKIADYPFTTLVPNLGIVKYKDFESFTVADIPGIIEGAHMGKGLGLQFLRHIERTSVLLFLIDACSENPEKDFETLNQELSKHSAALAQKEKLVAFSKSDLIDSAKESELKRIKLKNYHGPIFVISSVTMNGIRTVLDILWQKIRN